MQPLFTLLQFLSEYGVLKEPDEFISAPKRYIEKKNQQKEDRIALRISEKVGRKLKTQTFIFIGLTLTISSILLFLLVRYLYRCNRPRKLYNFDDICSDESWDDKRDFPSVD